LKRRIITTNDGSKTIQIEAWNEQYHSTHGAIQESEHVFIQKGLTFILKDLNFDNLAILEIGFGTGLNALKTCVATENLDTSIFYEAVEAFPVPASELSELNYTSLILNKNTLAYFDAMHHTAWNEAVEIRTNFTLFKRLCDFSDINSIEEFNLIYFDAFGPRVQPELWTETIFSKMYSALKSKGVLVTYSAKGSVRRALQAVGFVVERLPGPPGKREMLRAIK
jgi:tRNA U34 5-methylaminomethyl-2-thiouridine-forming methyltransferase MnmC